MPEPAVSIIIVNHNYADFLATAIDSALTDAAFAETIVVDDGSTDGSRDLIARYGSALKLVLQDNEGACAARNAGLAAARGRYVKFLDADDWLVQGALSAQLEAARTLPQDQKVAVFGDAVWVSSNGSPLAGHDPFADRPLALDVTGVVRHAPLTSCPLHRREDVVAVGGFDRRVMRGQEHDLHVRLALSGVSFLYQPAPVYHYRQHEGARRISHRRGADLGRSVLDATLRHVAEASAKGLLDTPLRDAFAHRLWRQGREVLQRGSPEVARRFFHEARLLSPTAPTPGPPAYRAMTRILGPIGAEKLSAARAKLRASFNR
ncbi:MAG: glycosyltransferase [Pseudomonadota bacterium]